MADLRPFDYYHVWLGIPPDEQPPDYYRLLGLRRFEADLNVISHAADRQMRHVRDFQNGPHSHYSQKLLNELSAARICLLNPTSKRPYDLKIQNSSSKSEPAVPPPHIEPPPVSVPQPEFQAIPHQRTRKKQPSSSGLWVGLAFSLAALTILVLIALSQSPSDVTVATLPVPTDPPETIAPPKLSPKPPLELVDLVPLIEPTLVHLKSDLGIGSGVIIDPTGIILTNYHVIAGAKKCTIRLKDGRQFEVKGAVAIDKGRDMALLVAKKLEHAEAIPIAGTLPRKGSRVASFGGPQGFAFAAAEGIVAGVWAGKAIGEIAGRNFQNMGFNPNSLWVQSTAPVANGNSGGPLVDMTGELVGLNTFTFKEGQNLNFAISTVTVHRLLLEADRKKLTPLDLLAPRNIAAVPGPPVVEPAEQIKEHQPIQIDNVGILPLDVWADLLVRFDVKKPGRIGTWEMRDDRLTLIETAGTATIELVKKATGAFDLALDFSLDDEAEHRLTLFLPTGKGQGVLDISAVPEPAISLASTKRGKPRATWQALPTRLAPDRPHQLVISVRPNGDRLSIKAAVDTKYTLAWEGPISEITILDELSGNADALCLSVTGPTATVHDAQIRRMSPTASLSTTAPDDMLTAEDLLGEDRSKHKSK